MNKKVWMFLLSLSFGARLCSAQDLSPKWEDLTSPEFGKAIQKAAGVCVLPMGSVEKFGPAGPVGTTLYVIRQVAMDAVRQEYAVVFPAYFVSAANSLSSYPGTIAYSSRLQQEMLEETTSEMARNGCKKILILHGSSSNTPMLTNFLNESLRKPNDCVVYAMHAGPPRMWPLTERTSKLPVAMRASKPNADGHGGEDRISALMANYPELVHLDRAHDEDAAPAAPRPKLPEGVQSRVSASTGHGDASGATVARGKALMEYSAQRAAEAIRAVKADEQSPQLQREFLEKMLNPTK